MFQKGMKTTATLLIAALLLVFASCHQDGEDGDSIVTNHYYDDTPTQGYNLEVCWDNNFSGYLQVDPGPEDNRLVNGCGEIFFTENWDCVVWVDCTDLLSTDPNTTWCAENNPPRSIVVNNVTRQIPPFTEQSQTSGGGYKVVLDPVCQ